jgi:beta-lactamase superfamily II metal-dependent hydrolase
MKLLYAFTLVLFPALSWADYIMTTTDATIRACASERGPVIANVPEGTYLLITDDAQEDHYYKVRSPLFRGEGWISRHIARRYKGDLPTSLKSLELVEDDDEKVEVRVIDVGAGLCTVIKLPGGQTIIYDAGNGGSKTLAQLGKVVNFGTDIELLVLSHTDQDHIAAAENILEFYKVKKLLWTGYNPKGTELFKSLCEAIKKMPEVEEINLHEKDSVITPGVKLKFGKATLSFLCGFNKPPIAWNMKGNAEKVNSVSIVMKLQYSRHSVLFCGDAVGWSPRTSPIATEQYLIQNAAHLLPSTILIAPHHGAENGNSDAFIEKVSPEYVIFSAGGKHFHPRAVAATRYLNHGVELSKIFRTDRGDDENTPNNETKEWTHQREVRCKDPRGDDDIRIKLYQRSPPRVGYINTNGGCISTPDDAADPASPLAHLNPFEVLNLTPADRRPAR